MLRKSELHVVEDGGHLFVLSKAQAVLPVLKSFLDRPVETSRRQSKFNPAPAL
jgi:hypothetical protein